MEKLKLVSPIPVSVNHYLGIRVVNKNGRPMAMTYKKPEAVKYQKDFSKYVIDEIKKQNWTHDIESDKHIYVDATFYFDRTDKDCSNYEKIMIDALTYTQMLWKDDNIVLFRPQRIYYDAENPRIELEIYPVDYRGIFNSCSQLEEFESNCIGCTRYTRNCSILNKAKEGRIQKEIENCICSKRKERKEK